MGPAPALQSSPGPVPPGGAEPALPGAAGLDFLAVYEEHVAFVWRSARRLGVADEALEDVVQEIFLVVHRRLADFEGRSSIRTWLFGIMLRVVQEHRRARRRAESRLERAGVDLEALPDHRRPCPLEQASRSEAAQIFQQLLEQLDDDKRAVLIMVELEEMPVPQIAEATGVNVNTVYARLRAARRELDEAVQRYCAREGRRLP
jgi:RNA polymerase sigma-70 factor, ECF subfamily